MHLMVHVSVEKMRFAMTQASVRQHAMETRIVKQVNRVMPQKYAYLRLVALQAMHVLRCVRAGATECSQLSRRGVM